MPDATWVRMSDNVRVIEDSVQRARRLIEISTWRHDLEREHVFSATTDLFGDFEFVWREPARRRAEVAAVEPNIAALPYAIEHEPVPGLGSVDVVGQSEDSAIQDRGSGRELVVICPVSGDLDRQPRKVIEPAFDEIATKLIVC